MEPEGLRRCLEEVKRKNIDVAVLATDHHNMVSCIMRNDFKEVNHELLHGIKDCFFYILKVHSYF